MWQSHANVTPAGIGQTQIGVAVLESVIGDVIRHVPPLVTIAENACNCGAVREGIPIHVPLGQVYMPPVEVDIRMGPAGEHAPEGGSI